MANCRYFCRRNLITELKNKSLQIKSKSFFALLKGEEEHIQAYLGDFLEKHLSKDMPSPAAPTPLRMKYTLFLLSTML